MQDKEKKKGRYKEEIGKRREEQRREEHKEKVTGWKQTEQC